MNAFFFVVNLFGITFTQNFENIKIQKISAIYHKYHTFDTLIFSNMS